MSYISRACSSLVRQPYYIPNRFLLKISGLETILATKKGRWDGRSFYMDEYTLIFLFSRCIRCAQKRYCRESVRFASERSRVRIPPSPPNQKSEPLSEGTEVRIFLVCSWYCRGMNSKRRMHDPWSIICSCVAQRSTT